MTKMKVGTRSKRLYEARARVLKALAQPLRLEMVEVLSEREMCVEELAKRLGASRSNVSRHLSVLAGAGILQSRKDGLKVFYSLKCLCALDFFSCVERVLEEQLSERISLMKGK